MRVFNDDITACYQCPNVSMEGYGIYSCSIIRLDDHLDCNKEIAPDCPFKQPITQEVIESLGFNFNNKEIGNYIGEILFFYFKKDNLHLYELLFFPKNNLINLKFNTIQIFYGKLNNSEELKFILKTLGI